MKQVQVEEFDFAKLQKILAQFWSLFDVKVNREGSFSGLNNDRHFMSTSSLEAVNWRFCNLF